MDYLHNILFDTINKNYQTNIQNHGMQYPIQ